MNRYRAVVRSESGVELVLRTREALPPSCVRVQIKRTGLCRTDCRAAQGLIPTTANLTLGHEASGVILEVGSVARGRLHVGQQVAIWPHLGCEACELCRTDRQCQALQLGVDRDGTFADEVVLPWANVHAYFDAMSFERAAYFEPVVAALGAFVSALKTDDAVYVHGTGRIAELTRRTLRFCGQPLVALEQSPAWIILPSPSVESVRALMRVAPNATFVLKTSSRGHFDRAAYADTQARFVTAMYGSKSRALRLLQNPEFDIDDLFDEALPLGALCSRLLSQDDETKKAFFNPELAD